MEMNSGLPSEQENSFHYLPAHEIYPPLGPKKAHVLPVFHALTGCDTVSAFVGHSKKSAWAISNALPELTDELVTLADAPTSIPETSLRAVERFVILLCERPVLAYFWRRQSITGWKEAILSTLFIFKFMGPCIQR